MTSNQIPPPLPAPDQAAPPAASTRIGWGESVLTAVFAAGGAGFGALTIGGALGGLLGAALGFGVYAVGKWAWRRTGWALRAVAACVMLLFVLAGMIAMSLSQPQNRTRPAATEIVDPFALPSHEDWDAIALRWETANSSFLADEWNARVMQEEINAVSRVSPSMRARDLLEMAHRNTLLRRQHAEQDAARAATPPAPAAAPFIQFSGSSDAFARPEVAPERPVTQIPPEHGAPESAQTRGTPARLPGWREMRAMQEAEESITAD